MGESDEAGKEIFISKDFKALIFLINGSTTKENIAEETSEIIIDPKI